MAVDDALGTVTICRHGRMGLYADDHGVTVRNAAPRARRSAWAEVSHFADGSVLNEGDYSWILLPVLRTGNGRPVPAPDGAHWTEFPRGQHFPAMKAPAQLAADLQAYFGPLQ